MLKLQFVEGNRESFWLATKKITLGGGSDNDLVVSGDKVAAFHAEIQSHNNAHYIVALKPNIVHVNNLPIERATELNVNDVIQLGDVELRLVQPKSQAASTPATEGSPWSLHISASWAKQSHFPIEGLVTVGRDDSCDITVPIAHLSRRHASISVTAHGLLVKDLDSTNGTFLNGGRITEACAKPGDKLKFDVVNFTVVGEVLSADENADQTVVRATHRVASVRPPPKAAVQPSVSAEVQVPKKAVPPAAGIDGASAISLQAKAPPVNPSESVAADPDINVLTQGQASKTAGVGRVIIFAAVGLALGVILALLQK